MLAKISTDAAETDVAKIAMGSALMIESARHLADAAAEIAAKGTLNPDDRLSLA